MDLKSRNFQILLLIIILGISLRLYGLGTASIKADEGGTIFLSERSIYQIITSAEDVQPPFFYAVLHFWIALVGKSEFMLRLLPAIFSILTIPLAYKLGKILFNEDVGLFSAFVFSVSQANIRFAQNLRNYSLVTFFVLLSIYFFYQYLSNPNKKYLILFVVSSVISVYSHYFAGFVLVAQVLYLLIYYKKYRESFVKLSIAFIAIFVLLSPLATMFFWQASIETNLEKAMFEKDSLTDISLTALNQNNIFVRISLFFYHFSVGFLEFNLQSPFFVAILFLAIIVYATFFFTALRSLLQQSKEKLMLLLLILIVPTALLSVLWLSKIIVPLAYTRYLLYISPIYYTIIGVGLFTGISQLESLKSNLLKKSVLVIFIVLILSFNSVSLLVYYDSDPKKEDWRSAVSLINSKSNGNEVIGIYSGAYTFNLKSYLLKDLEIYTLPENFNIRGATLSKILYSSFNPINESNSCNILNLLDESKTGIWYVHAAPTSPSDKDLIKKCLDSNLKLADSFENSYTNSRGTVIKDLLVYHYVVK